MKLIVRMLAVAMLACNAALLVGMVGAFGVSAVSAVFCVAWLSAAFAILGKPSIRVLIAALLMSTLLPVVVLSIGAAGSAARWWSAGPMRPDAFFLSSVTPERELAIGGAWLLWAAGEMEQGRDLVPHFRAAYDEMMAEALFAPTPLLASGLGATDGIRFGADDAETVAVFLHGKGGNFTLNCWQFARAVRESGIATVCPTLDFEGNWARDGEAIVNEAVTVVREQGAKRVILAGLSNGAIGASVLAPRANVDGLVLVAGLSRYAQPTELPTLLITGDDDPVAPKSRVVAYRAKNVEVAVLEGDHFVFLTKYEEFREPIAAWAVKFSGR